MARGVIEVHGKEVEVREDTFKAYQGVRWAIISIITFIAIAAILFFAGLITSVKDGSVESPAQTERPHQ